MSSFIAWAGTREGVAIPHNLLCDRLRTGKASLELIGAVGNDGILTIYAVMH